MEKTVSLTKIEKEVANLSTDEKLKVVEKLVRQLRKSSITIKKELDWNKLYGLGKGLWREDAQEYVNRIRENRI